jgi:hypothetical protein
MTNGIPTSDAMSNLGSGTGVLTRSIKGRRSRIISSGSSSLHQDVSSIIRSRTDRTLESERGISSATGEEGRKMIDGLAETQDSTRGGIDVIWRHGHSGRLQIHDVTILTLGEATGSHTTDTLEDSV